MFNKVILITGAASGFGRYLAEKLILDYHIVYATDKNEADLLYLEEMGARIYKMDVTKENDVNFVISEIIEKEGRIDVLVNNAGYGEIGYIEHISMDDHRYQFEVNYFAPLNLIQKVLPYMKFENRGQIINIASVVSNFSLKAFGAYSASKAALKSALIALAREVKDLNIKINIVEPDASNTNFVPTAKARYLDRIETTSDLKMGGYDEVFLNEVVPKYLDNTFNVSPTKTVNLILKLIKSDSKKLVKQSNTRGLLLSVFSKVTTSNFIAKFLENGMLRNAKIKKSKNNTFNESYYDYQDDDYNLKTYDQYDYQDDNYYDQNLHEDTLDLQLYDDDYNQYNDNDYVEDTFVENDFSQNDYSLYNNQQDISANNDYENTSNNYDSSLENQTTKRNFKIKETTPKHTNIENKKKIEKKSVSNEEVVNSKKQNNEEESKNIVSDQNNEFLDQNNEFLDQNTDFSNLNNVKDETDSNSNDDYVNDIVDDFENEWF